MNDLQQCDSEHQENIIKHSKYITLLIAIVPYWSKFMAQRKMKMYKVKIQTRKEKKFRVDTDQRQLSSES